MFNRMLIRPKENEQEKRKMKKTRLRRGEKWEVDVELEDYRSNNNDGKDGKDDGDNYDNRKKETIAYPVFASFQTMLITRVLCIISTTTENICTSEYSALLFLITLY